MKKIYILLVVTGISCIQVSRPERSKSCHSDLECPLGSFCDFATHQCIEGKGLLDDIKEAEGIKEITEAIPACTEGEPCDDHNPCTYNDTCTKGICQGTSYSCKSERSCVLGECLGNGSCHWSIKAGWCLIDGRCYKAGVQSPENQCMACVPEVSQNMFVPDDTQKCDDHDPETTGDHCEAGRCVGKKEEQ